MNEKKKYLVSSPLGIATTVYTNCFDSECPSATAITLLNYFFPIFSCSLIQDDVQKNFALLLVEEYIAEEEEAVAAIMTRLKDQGTSNSTYCPQKK